MGKNQLYLASILAGLCQAYIGYDSAAFSAVILLPDWVAFMNNPSSAQLGFLQTCYTIPTIVLAVLLTPYIQDRWGRSVSMCGGSIGVIVAAIVMGTTPTPAGFWAGRVCLGIGQGFVYAAPTYMSEIAGRNTRGRIVGIWQITWAIGALISTLIALGAQRNSNRFLELAFDSTASIVGIWFVPESPRWLMEKDRIEDARKSLRRLRSDESVVDDELTDIVEAVKWERENTTKMSIREVFVDKSLRHRLIMTCFLNLFNQVCGNNALTNFGSKVYQSAFASNTIALTMTAVQDVVQILGALLAIIWVDRFGRRKALFWGALIMALMLVLAGALPVGYGDTFVQHKAAAAVMVVGICLFYLAFGPSWGASVWIVTAEVFPMNVRAQLVGISSQFQKIGSLSLGQAFPTMFSNLGFKSLFVFAGFNIFMAIIVWFFLPETKGVALEEMDAIFGGVNRVLAQKKKDGLVVEEASAVDVKEGGYQK